MIRRALALVAAGLLVSACNTTSGTSSGATAATAAPSAQSAFVGDWSGKFATGNSVRVTISGSGSPTYYYNGRMNAVSSFKVSGDTMSFRVGRGTGLVTLKAPAGGKMAYIYQEGGETHPLTLSKS
ncbi:hypothetical protein GCM10011390_06340 [Aureimonas endophytica]|uniref:Lipoprotein n=1 Tax=Aureimonas endophytica TaxID=2027858 RepID=A0A917E1P5_9HYPH|nr:hypothetical protein [Aureimonas endophytica]GGD90299.1 hypothetical protein GCM10011390_06340 [Aureimonas endophytica]